jgi:hypothetical protein
MRAQQKHKDVDVQCYISHTITPLNNTPKVPLTPPDPSA